MKYTTILLTFLAATLVSCSSMGGGDGDVPDSTAIDSVKADTLDDRVEAIDTIKKKTVSTRYTSKCNAFKRWSES
jgi:hypothetical protein